MATAIGPHLATLAGGVPVELALAALPLVVREWAAPPCSYDN